MPAETRPPCSSHAAPGLAVVDRLVTLRPVKRMGRLLDEDRRAVGAVPMDVWADPLEEP